MRYILKLIMLVIATAAVPLLLRVQMPFDIKEILHDSSVIGSIGNAGKQSDSNNKELEAFTGKFSGSAPKDLESASADGFTFKEYNYYDGNGFMVTGYNGNENDIVIPEVYKGKYVIAIGDAAFKESDIHSVEMPESILWIGKNAFNGCQKLRGIVFSENLCGMGNHAFSKCISVETINLGENIAFIDEYAFSGCQFLESIEIKGGKFEMTVKRGAFSECPSLVSAVLPDCISVMDIGLFSGDAALTEVDFAKTGITQHIALAGTTFKGCSSLKKVVNSGIFTAVNDRAFSECTVLEEVDISGVTVIERQAFYKCENLGSVNLPQGLTSIGESAFSGCSSLNGIAMPDTLETIDEYAFNKCGMISAVNIPASVVSIGNDAFNGCDSLSELVIDENGKSLNIGGMAFKGSGLISVVLPGRTESIGNQAFAGCESLQSFTLLPEKDLYNIQVLDNNITKDCGALYEVHLPSTVSKINNDNFRNVSIYAPEGSYAAEWAVQNNKTFCPE